VTIVQTGVMDSGLALRAPRNDALHRARAAAAKRIGRTDSNDALVQGLLAKTKRVTLRRRADQN